MPVAKTQSSLYLALESLPSSDRQFSLDVKTKIPPQGVTALFGPSGSGKTSLLRAIAGLDSHLTGDIIFGDQVWQSQTYRLATYRRPIGYVFQESSLFEHLNGEQNLRFALNRADTSQLQIQYSDVVELMQIGPLLKRYPHQLSGGERQRIAIARALLIQPKLLLMDEPLSALDDALKQEILPYLETLCHQTQLPIIYVSHALDEVIRLADNMLVLHSGRITDQGPTQELLGKLGTTFCHYQDASVVIQGKLSAENASWGLSELHFDGQRLRVKTPERKIGEDVKVRVQAKDVSLSLSAHDDTSILNRLQVKVDQIAQEPNDNSMFTIRLLAGKTPILARITGLSVHHLQLKTGMTLYAQIKSVAVIV
ncbi:molybdenum ABC transporter ATP-binding protein [Marinomonas sp.]